MYLAGRRYDCFVMYTVGATPRQPTSSRQMRTNANASYLVHLKGLIIMGAAAACPNSQVFMEPVRR
eukprot:6174350-Pleurochrysis_carterae.AAC.1